MPHWFIVLGSTVGFLTGLYTLCDRLLRDRPILSLARGDAPGELVLRIKNGGRGDIVLFGIASMPRTYTLALENELREILRAVSGDNFVHILGPDQEVKLPLITYAKDGRRSDERDHKVLMLIYWRKTRSTWLRQVPLLDGDNDQYEKEASRSLSGVHSTAPPGSAVDALRASQLRPR